MLQRQQNKMVVLKADHLCHHLAAIANPDAAKLSQTYRRTGRLDHLPCDPHNETLAIQQVDVAQRRMKSLEINLIV
jgi:hypothetical protein